ncbi:MAG: winged helix-turn-helix transcriptional regulator [Clostridia bacterium]|nr:winged helix-turn-helix transcriptional regulator [Clostridia bacterium]
MTEQGAVSVRIFSADRIFSRMLMLELADAGISASVSSRPPEWKESRPPFAVIVDADAYPTAERIPPNAVLFGYEYRKTDEPIRFFQRPFAVDGLIAAVRELLASDTPKEQNKKARNADRAEIGQENKAVSDRLAVDEPSGRVFYGDTEIILTEKERALLLLLYRNRGRAVSREEILYGVWGRDCGDRPPETNLTDVYIRYLREKIDDRFDTRCIFSVRGKGYMIK